MKKPYRITKDKSPFVRIVGPDNFMLLTLDNHAKGMCDRLNEAYKTGYSAGIRSAIKAVGRAEGWWNR